MLDRAYNIGANKAYEDILIKLSGVSEVTDRTESDTEMSDMDPRASKEDGKVVKGLIDYLNSVQVGISEDDEDKKSKRKKRDNGPAINKKVQWSNKVQLDGYGY